MSKRVTIMIDEDLDKKAKASSGKIDPTRTILIQLLKSAE